MGRVDIPGVVRLGGRYYRRSKVKGADGKWRDHYVRLPDIAHPGFAEALARANRTVADRAAPGEGTMAALAGEFRSLIARKKLAPATKTNQLRYVGMIEEQHGKRLVRDLRPKDVYRLRNNMADRPGVANNYLAVLRAMMALACQLGLRDDNPAAGVEPLELGEHEPWPAEVLAAVLAAAPPMLRFAVVTHLCSGQRVSDVIRMQHNWHDRALMQFEQKKTRKFVAVPMHPMWLAEIDKTERRAITLHYDRTGKPFASTEPLQSQLRRLMRSLGIEGYTLHGLRKNACCYLLELGLSDTEVGAILGMTPEIVRHYGKRASVLMIARGAAARATSGDVLRMKR